jgi:hypothetical protein
LGGGGEGEDVRMGSMGQRGEEEWRLWVVRPPHPGPPRGGEGAKSPPHPGPPCGGEGA